MFGRDRPCVGPWRQAGQINDGLFFIVAIILFIVKVYKPSSPSFGSIALDRTLSFDPTITPPNNTDWYLLTIV
jgi:hypothetical protein